MDTANKTLNFDPESGLWEARDPALVQALLADTRLGVRPPAQALPPHLQGRPFGQVFGRWLRMRDDPGHRPAKAQVSAALDALPDDELRTHARQQAQLAFAAGWNHGLWATSACTMASLAGLPVPDLAAQRSLLGRLGDMAAALRPDAMPAQLDAADAACEWLLHALSRPLGLPPKDEAANRLALVWQSYEAGAALIGQGLIRLASEPALRQAHTVAAWLPELQKRPGVVLITRRFALRAMQIGEVSLQPGDGLLLHLSGSEEALGFGHGPHRCPGARLALNIAVMALEQVIASPGHWPGRWQVRTLPNMRIPIFEASTGA